MRDKEKNQKLFPAGRRKGDRLLFWQRPGPPSFLERGRKACGGCLPAGRPEGLLPVDTGTQQSEFMNEQRLINPLKPLDWGLDW